MQRPKPEAKMGRSWLVSWRGIRWRIKRLHRYRPLSIVDWWFQGDLFGLTRVEQLLVRRLKMLKPNGPVSKGTAKLAADDPEAFKDLPHLRGFFLNQTYDGDSSERAPGLLILKCSADGWQFTLKDTTSCVMLRLHARTLSEGFMLADATLGSPNAPWETDPYEAGKRAKSRGRKG